MFFPLPNVSVNLGFGGKSKASEKKDEPIAATLKPAEALQLSATVDPVMLLMGTALVLMAAAMLVYAARS
jgi:hypothetical protein